MEFQTKQLDKHTAKSRPKKTSIFLEKGKSTSIFCEVTIHSRTR